MDTQTDFDVFLRDSENGVADPNSKYSILLGELLKSVDQESIAFGGLDGDWPESFCHYTDFAGLNGILSSHELWFTYNRTLNDSAEQKHGLTLIAEHLCKKQMPIEQQRSMQHGLRYPRRFFVCCFCQSSQVLSMWRSYANFGGGFCLEFDSNKLQQYAFGSKVHGHIYKMAYYDDDAKLSQEAVAYIDKVAAFGEGSVDQALVAGYVMGQLLVKFKHGAFREEQEWRMILQNPPVKQMDFRPDHADIKPYVRVRPRLADDSGGVLPLKRIVLGPTLRNDGVVAEVLMLMLERHGYRGVPVQPSDIPYRL